MGIWNSITGTREKNDVTWTLDLKERAYPEYLQNKGTVAEDGLRYPVGFTKCCTKEIWFRV